MLETLECLNQKSIELLQEHNLLDKLCRAIVVKSALSTISIDSEEENKEVNKFIQNLGVTNENEFKEWMKTNKTDEKEVRRVVVKAMKIKHYYKKNFANKVDSRFLDRKSNFDIVIYSLIKVKDFFKARELYLRLIDNEASFGDLSEKYSEGIERKTKGIIGPIELNKAHPLLVEILKSSKPGIINPPKQIKGFWLVTRLESYDSAKLDDFMREKMGEELFNEHIETKTEELSESFRNQSIS